MESSVASAAPITSLPRGKSTNMNRGSSAMFSTPPRLRPMLAWEEYPAFRSRWATVMLTMLNPPPSTITRKVYCRA